MLNNCQLFYNPLNQQTISIPKFICDLTEFILIRLIHQISLNELSILRSCLPAFLFRLFQQKPQLNVCQVADWIVDGMKNSWDESFEEEKKIFLSLSCKMTSRSSFDRTE